MNGFPAGERNSPAFGTGGCCFSLTVAASSHQHQRLASRCCAVAWKTRHARSTACVEHERLHSVHASTLRHRIPTDSREITRLGLLSRPRPQIDGALYSICRRISSFPIIAPKNYLQDRCRRHKTDVLLWIFARCKWILGDAEHGRRPEALHERCCYRHSIATSLRTEVVSLLPFTVLLPS